MTPAVALHWQLVLGTGWSSRLIAWWGQGYGGFSHVDAILPDGSCLGARNDVIDPLGLDGKPTGKVIPAGVQIRPPGYEKWKRRCVLKLPCEVETAQRWERILREQVNSPYDQSDILGLIIGKPISSSGHWICSALQAYALESVGVLPHLPISPQQITPNMFQAIVCTLGAAPA